MRGPHRHHFRRASMGSEEGNACYGAAPFERQIAYSIAFAHAALFLQRADHWLEKSRKGLDENFHVRSCHPYC